MMHHLKMCFDVLMREERDVRFRDFKIDRWSEGPSAHQKMIGVIRLNYPAVVNTAVIGFCKDESNTTIRQQQYLEKS